jgi:hypothetical protein
MRLKAFLFVMICPLSSCTDKPASNSININKIGNASPGGSPASVFNGYPGRDANIIISSKSRANVTANIATNKKH